MNNSLTGTEETSYLGRLWQSIEDMPIYNWIKILETGDLKWLFVKNKGRVSSRSQEHWMELQQEYLDEFVKSGRCHFHKEYSVDGAKLFDDSSVDLVFIDANHTYEHVKEDIEAWYPKIRDGGILSGHDFNGDFPGVEKAVREYFEPKKKDIFLSYNSVWVVNK